MTILHPTRIATQVRRRPARLPPSLRLVLAAVALLVAPWPGAGSASAQAPLFLVEEVGVDATAEDANAAREIALGAGMRDALERLLKRIAPREHYARLPNPSPEEVAGLVYGIEVHNERTSVTRYLASLTVSFAGDSIRGLLQAAGVPFTETPARPALVLPVYSSAGARILWDDPNPWRAAWDDVVGRDTLAPVVLPNGDLTDVALIGAAQAVAGDRARLDAIANRYGVLDVLVAEATVRFEIGSRTPSVDVVLRRSGASGEGVTIEGYRGQPGETVPELLARAVQEIANGREERWKRETLLQFGTQDSLIATVPIANLGEWVRVRRLLEEAPEVRIVDLMELSPGSAQVGVTFFGDSGRLVLALAQRDLVLGQEDGFWVLRLRSGAGAQ